MNAKLWTGVLMMNITMGLHAFSPTRFGDQSEWMLENGWSVFAAGKVTDMNEIHQPGWTFAGAVETKVPATVFGALVDAGKVGDPFWDKRLAEYDTAPYDEPWIYRTEFDLDPSRPSDYVELIFEGINYRGNVWLNGTPVVESVSFEGPYRMYRFDITACVKTTRNVLVVEIIPPAKDDLTIGWVDWNPYPPDDNLGIWRPVKIKQSGAVSFRSPFVKTDLDLESFLTAELEINGVLENHSLHTVSGMLQVSYELGSFDVPFELKAGETRELVMDSTSWPVLNVRQPKIWWPRDMGDQPLYQMEFRVNIGSETSELHRIRFGIREVADYINEQGHRGWMVNGKRVLIRGGGWVDDLFLREDLNKLRNQIDYVAHMNLNTIRLEGFWGSTQTLFDLCDEAGILVMMGWSCHWEWENYCNRPQEDYLLIRPDEASFHAKSFADQVVWVRNHPSVLTWVFGSDMIPRPSLERELKKELDRVDPTRPRLLGCRNQAFGGEQFYSSEDYGPVAVKMIGPYHYVTPNYWYEDTQLGGAFGFNTETGPGLQPAVLESVKRFTPEDRLWPLNDVWDFHTGRGDVFGSFKDWIQPFESRYGTSTCVEDFCAWAQVSNYEAIRPMFEAFSARKPVATGVIQWMLNSAFPNHLWQLYDYYLMPTGAFYGTRKACQSVNALYDYANHRILLTNDTLQSLTGMHLDATLMDSRSHVLWSARLDDLSLVEQSISALIDLPELEGQSPEVFFLDVRLYDQKGGVVANNFYWISNTHEDLDYEKSTWYHTPNAVYADFSGLRHLPQAEVDATFRETGTNGNRRLGEVELHNKSEYVAFFIELSVRDGRSGDTLLPVFWEDNYVSLLPGEKRTLHVEYPDVSEDQSVMFTWSCLNASNSGPSISK